MIELKSSMKKEHKGKIGLLKRKDGSIIYDDSWVHTDLVDDFGVLEKSMGRLNRAKLVQKRVPVKGKDGKIFYRMQWVDPTKDMIQSDDSIVDENNNSTKVSNEKEAGLYVTLDKEEERVEEVPNTELEAEVEWKDLVAAITDKLKKMSVDDKIELMQKCGINDADYSDRIGWMKNVQKLKWYLRDNPHLIDLEQIPKKDTTPNNVNSLQDILNKSTDESIYALIKKLGIADEDPRKNPKYSEKNAGIRHFNNIMRLKMELKANESLLKELDTKNPISNDKDKSIIENNGHDVTTILNSISREDKYKLMRILGINDGTDPMYNPAFLVNNSHAKMHMQYMMKLRKAIEMNPKILNNLDTKVENPDREPPKDNLNTVRGMLKECSRELKESLLYKYKKHPTLLNMEKSENPSVNWMRSMMALTEILAEDDNIENFKSSYDTDKLYNHKFINKDIEKFLRSMANIRGERAQVYQAEKGMEWGFGEESYVRKNYDENDNPVLTVVDFNEDGIESETDYPIKDVVEFLSGKSKSKEKAKPKAQELYKDVPLHELPYQEMMARIKKEGASIVDDDTLSIIKGKASSYWNNIDDETKLSGSWNIVSDILTGLNKKQMMNFLRHFGITCNEDKFSSTSKEWFKMVYPDKFQEGRKLMASNEYLIKIGENTYTDALHESAKNWSDAEISESVSEFAEDMINIDSIDTNRLPEYITPEQVKENSNKIIDTMGEIFNTLPYDVFTDIATSGIMKGGIKFLTDTSKMTSIGAYSNSDGCIYLTRSYVDTLHYSGEGGAYSSGVGFDWTKENNGKAPALKPLSEIVLHEFGHAVDQYFRGNYDKRDNRIARWESGKYIASDQKSSINRSFSENVSKSNKKKVLGFVPTGGTDDKGNPKGYYYMKDNWLSPYEGRLYSLTGSLNENSDGSYSLTDTNSYSTGEEHWAENFERVMNSVLKYKQDNGGDFNIDDYKSMVQKHFEDREFAIGEQVFPKGTEDNVYFRAGAVLNNNPTMFNTLKNLFIRGNFKEDDK